MRKERSTDCSYPLSSLSQFYSIPHQLIRYSQHPFVTRQSRNVSDKIYHSLDCIEIHHNHLDYSSSQVKPWLHSWQDLPVSEKISEVENGSVHTLCELLRMLSELFKPNKILGSNRSSQQANTVSTDPVANALQDTAVAATSDGQAQHNGAADTEYVEDIQKNTGKSSPHDTILGWLS